NHFKDQLDCSSYPKDHPFYDSTNDRILGKFKDEAKGLSITQFCGLKAKLYSYCTLDEHTGQVDNKKKAKGTQKSAADLLKHSLYTQCLDNDDFVYRVINRRFVNHLHELSTIEQNKIALCGFDDKKFYLDSRHSLPYGHWRTRINQI
ncbi:MAG: hypothetical protein P4L31_07100, partial [Candidatus Babeliales bacterium]|nr:hypothetical protein [Candidatus Babeliales bacterium]